MALLRFQVRIGSLHRPLDVLEVWDTQHHLLAELDADFLAQILEHYMAGASLTARLITNVNGTVDHERKEMARMTKPSKWSKKAAQSITGVLLLLLLTGCATTWRKDNSTLADFRTDSYACERDASRVPITPQTTQDPSLGWAGVADTFRARALYRRCMEARGWVAD